MPRFLAALMLLVLASPAFAVDKDKPNTLTEQETGLGWVQLFDGETTFGWTIDGPATVKDGWLVFGGDKPVKAHTNLKTSGGHVAFEAAWSGEKQPTLHLFDVSKDKNKNTIDDIIEFKKQGIKPPWAKLQGSIREPYAVEPVARVEVPAGSELRLRSVQFFPNGRGPLTKLFTGKDLTGWKVNGADPKRMASKWEVTKAGELSVKNGPGDLVTEKEFDNFVLQFECKTLGKALNSGFFFRCIPGQYQNGYEAQIQNAFKDDDRTKPADFGTGAIYRRVAARRVVSNDNEWFTMTVVANGKHIATWVNGYQVVDWTDDRNPNDNPRQGYRAAKGPISIQGHDPTTDILFRNIRIAELPK
ncbi:MAG: DUF1080 domain-containing protein [Planctomycetes bacterium]|nr:DUF1080 domain-containing protein [Planctomycetota bacterium]